MRFLALLVAVAFFLEDCLAESRVEYITRLKRDLFKTYDKDVIPYMKTGKAVQLAAGLSMYDMELTEKGDLDFTAWARFTWKDERLSWKPEEYGGIDVLRIPGRDVWIPDMEIYNAIEYGPGYFSQQMQERSQNAILYPSGSVLFIPPVHGKVRCNDEEFADWPWGDYDCRIKLGSWTFDGLMMNLTKYNDKDSISQEENYSSNVIFTEDSFKEDPLLTKFYPCCEEPYMSLNYHFKVQRKWRMTETGMESNPNLKTEYTEK